MNEWLRCNATAAGQAGADGVDLPYLVALEHSVPSAVNARRHAEIVAEKAAQRALIAAADESLSIALEAAPVTEKTDRICSLFSGLGLRARHQLPRPAYELLAGRIDHWQALADGTQQDGIRTHIPALNEALNGGLKPGKVYVLAARPSVGKSSLAEHIALHAAGDGHAAAFLSQEMDEAEVVDRAVANLGRVDFGALQRGQVDDWADVTAAVERLQALPFYVDDQPALTLSDVRAKALSLKRAGLKVLVLDYLQLCAGSGRRENRNAEIEEISRGIKALAKEMGLAVVLLSQLNREVERRASPEPTLADLRDSGAIEQDADVVMFLWRVREFSDRQVLGLSLPKNRRGKAGLRIALEFQRRFQRWHESEADISPPGKRWQGRGSNEPGRP